MLYKLVISVKSLNNFSNNELHDPHGFKGEIKNKFEAVIAAVEKLSNGIGAMMELLKAEPIPLTWADYCTMPVTEQLTLEEKDDAVTKSILLLMSSKNNNTKKDPCLPYS